MSMSARPSKQGDVIFRLDSARQEAALLTAKRKIAEVDAAMLAAQSDIMRAKASFRRQKARCSRRRTTRHQKRTAEAQPGIVPQRRHRELGGGCGPPRFPRRRDRFQTIRDDAAERSAAGGEGSAEAGIGEAQVDLDKTFIRAGFDGRSSSFGLKPGDIVTPNRRTAGVLIPEGAVRRALMAGFGQIEAQVMKVGMVAEAHLHSRPGTIIPMVVTSVQDYIAAGSSGAANN